MRNSAANTTISTLLAGAALLASALMIASSASAFSPRSVGATRAPVAAMAGGTARSYTAGNYALELDGVNVGFVKSVEGGDIVAEVINEPVGPTYFVKKHIGTPKYTDIVLKVGFSNGKALYDWIAASWAMNYQRKNGAIIGMDYKLTAKTRMEFFNALITETGIPACDGSSKEPAYLTLKIAPEYTRQVKASGKLSGEIGKSEQKLWLPQNFRLEIAGLDATKVNKIEAFTVKQTVTADATGQARDYAKEPGKLEIPNLKVSMSEVSADTWLDWHEDFLIKGNNNEDKEKTGSLVFLSPNRQTELLRINFFNLGIFKIGHDAAEANSDQIKRVSAEMYVERMEFTYLNQMISRLTGDPRS